jgi:uncharacterized membrane protein
MIRDWKILLGKSASQPDHSRCSGARQEFRPGLEPDSKWDSQPITGTGRRMRRIWNTVLKGLVAILPIGLTLYIVYWLAVAAERLFSRLITLLVPDQYYWPGLGLVAGLLFLYAVGLAVNAYIVRRVLRLGDDLLARIPVVKTIYVATRDFMRFLPTSGKSRDLKRVVLVPFGPGKVIGFVTSETRGLLGEAHTPDDTVAVYLPMSYMVGGYTVFLRRESLEQTTLSVEAGMRLALMGGVQSEQK